jgi:hypothetical protein
MGRILIFQNLPQTISWHEPRGAAHAAFRALLQSTTIVAKPSYATYTWSPVGAEIMQCIEPE